MINKVLIRDKNKLYWRKGDLHCKDGMIKESEILNSTNLLLSHTGKEFKMFNANFVDQIKKIKRGPATLTLKDLGYILINSGVNKDSIVVDAGSGCGLLAAVMGRFAKKVISYEIKPEHLKIAKQNIDFLQSDNVELKEGNVYEKIDEKNIDILTLDLAEPWKVNFNCVKNGGTIIIYLPTITQVSEFCSQCQDHVEKVIELLEREWHVEGKKVRPKSQMLGHTAFLIVVRKL
jgi:tRNA (adenine57-N1/adenine58-N1)-methyltransferase